MCLCSETTRSILRFFLLITLTFSIPTSAASEEEKEALQKCNLAFKYILKLQTVDYEYADEAQIRTADRCIELYDPNTGLNSRKRNRTTFSFEKSSQKKRYISVLEKLERVKGVTNLNSTQQLQERMLKLKRELALAKAINKSPEECTFDFFEGQAGNAVALRENCAPVSQSHAPVVNRNSNGEILSVLIQKNPPKTDTDLVPFK